MKLANSTVFAIAVAGGFSLAAYVMGQAPGAAGSGPATSQPTNAGQSMPGQTQGLAQPQTTIGPITGATIGPTTSATIGPITSATIGPITSATIGPITSATIGPITSATIGPITGPGKSTSAKSKASNKKTSTKPSAATSPKQ